MKRNAIIAFAMLPVSPWNVVVNNQDKERIVTTS